MRNFVSDTNIDFMSRGRWAAIVSGSLLVISLLAILVRGLNFGVDFTGGYTIEVGYQNPPDLNVIRDTLAGTDLPDAQVQSFGTSTDVLIRMAPREGLSGADVSSEVLSTLRGTSDAPIEMRRVEFVGPQVGVELREKGGLAILTALIGIAIYVWVRFEKKFALGSVLATVHDVVVTVGVFAVFGIEFDLTVLAAVLAVIGYSLNDTIVVFDRIRENFRLQRTGTPAEIMNAAINQTLSRTLITSGTTLIVVISLYLFGGEIINGFSLALLVGIGFGTYSSIFVASLLVYWLGVSREDLMPVVKEGADLDAMP